MSFYLPFDEVRVGTILELKKFTAREVAFGVRLCAELMDDNKYLVLPERYAAYIPKIDYMNHEFKHFRTYIVFKGKQSTKGDCVIIDIIQEPINTGNNLSFSFKKFKLIFIPFRI